jgi:hypothetical protein
MLRRRRPVRQSRLVQRTTARIARDYVHSCLLEHKLSSRQALRSRCCVPHTLQLAKIRLQQIGRIAVWQDGLTGATVPRSFCSGLSERGNRQQAAYRCRRGYSLEPRTEQT